MNTLIIGFGHKARHGKDTLAQLVHERMPGATKIYSFAAALKAYCRVAGLMTKKDGRILQLVGTDLFRSINENIWVDILRMQIEEESPAVALIPDMRFPNELKFVQEYGFGIKVSRWRPDGTLYVTTDRDPNHPSETALDNGEFDIVFDIQDGDRTALGDAADTVCNLIRGRQ